VTWLCLKCGRPFETGGNELGPKCPHCGSDHAWPSQKPEVGGEIQSVTTMPVPPPTPAVPYGDRAEHLTAHATSISLQCVNGHTFGWRAVPTDYGPCPHGTEITVIKGQPIVRSLQVELNCSCGAHLSVVGEVGSRQCPRCGKPMICPKCAAGASTDQEVIACPVCGGPPSAVTGAPAITFRGAVNKVVQSTPVPAPSVVQKPTPRKRLRRR
jgi:DNA-directed RNA polymerase subunit RPC12/RpoP